MHVAFDDRTVVVTGAAHGFGRAISRAFAERGAAVWACDVLEEALAETAALCRAAGGRRDTRFVDVTERASIRGFVAEAERARG